MTERSPLPEDKGPTFDPGVHWCARHLEPFRATWGENVNWAFAMFALFDVCIRREDIMRACGWTPDGGHADIRLLDRVLREFSPLCCLVGDETIEKWTTLALGELEVFKREHEALRATAGPA